MRKYKVSLLRIGHAIVRAESKEKAAQMAVALEEPDVHWLKPEDGLPGSRLVTFVEEISN